MSKPRGRPREFDENHALDRALLVFGQKGYDGATIDDLVLAMGIGRPSLYATFGDKEALFARCLDHYSATVGAKTVVAFRAEQNVHGAVRALLRQAVLNATGKESAAGCIMTCLAPAVDDPKVRRVVAESIRAGAEMVEARLLEAIREGELHRGFPAAERARKVIDASSALTLRARVGASREDLLTEADDWALLLVPDERKLMGGAKRKKPGAEIQ